MTKFHLEDNFGRSCGWIEIDHQGDIVRTSPTFTSMKTMQYTVDVLHKYAAKYSLSVRKSVGVAG